MPTKREGPTFREVTLGVLAELTGPAPVDSIVEQVLARFHSQSKDPPKRVRDLFHSWDLVGTEPVYLDSKTIVPLRLAMPGVRFRVPLGPEQIKEGLVTIQPHFAPFLTDRFPHHIAQEGLELSDRRTYFHQPRDSDCFCADSQRPPLSRRSLVRRPRQRSAVFRHRLRHPARRGHVHD